MMPGNLKLPDASMLLSFAFVTLRDHPRSTGLFRGPVLDVGESDLLDVPILFEKHAEERYATLP
jgi:hypothetical protein